MAGIGAVLTAMITPFDAQLGVDEEGLVTLARHLVEHGSDGVVLCGTTGEAATLTDEEHLRVVALGVEALAGRGTVVAGAGSNDTRHACHLTERATELGVDAILSVTPYYNRPNRRGIVRHFEEVARATDRPIILYNIPSRTATDMPNDLLAELAQIDGITAVKQANAANLALIDGLLVYAGNDDMLADVVELGGAGGILVASHLVGERMRRMVDEPASARAIDAELAGVWDALAITTNPIPVKAALNMLGLPAGGLRLPMVEADERESTVVREMLERHGLLEPAHA